MEPHRIERARDLRREQTPPEGIVWAKLRGRRLGGFKFRRQQSIGPYVADFYCAEAKLVVEVDGSMHDRQRDARRDEWMRSEGYETLRFSASRVSKDLISVLRTILEACRERSSMERE